MSELSGKLLWANPPAEPVAQVVGEPRQVDEWTRVIPVGISPRGPLSGEIDKIMVVVQDTDRTYSVKEQTDE